MGKDEEKGGDETIYLNYKQPSIETQSSSYFSEEKGELGHFSSATLFLLIL
jgi:hypothetical protein